MRKAWLRVTQHLTLLGRAVPGTLSPLEEGAPPYAKRIRITRPVHRPSAGGGPAGARFGWAGAAGLALLIDRPGAGLCGCARRSA